jgi:hypothetical protein
MTPLEKARELVEKYYWIFGDGYLGQQHIQCALIEVDEKIAYAKTFGDVTQSDVEEFEQVKKEIEKL